MVIALMPAVTPAQSPWPQSASEDPNPPRIIFDGSANRSTVDIDTLPDVSTPDGSDPDSSMHGRSTIPGAAPDSDTGVNVVVRPNVGTDPSVGTDQNAGTDPDAGTGVDASTDQNAGTGVDVSTGVVVSTGVDASTDPLIDVRRRWREAVRTGATDLGFRAFVLGALEPATHGLAGPMKRPLDGTNADPPPGIFERPQAERTRDASVSWENRAGPVGLGKAGRVVTVFGASIPTAFCAPLIVCTIELEPGEKLTDTPSWGDTVRWQVIPKVQGDNPQTTVFEVKPSDDAGMTNLIIPTNRRLYNITLVNSARGPAGDERVYTPILSFTYPDTAEKQVRQRIAERKAMKAEEARRATAARAAAAKKREEALQRNGVETAAGLRDAGSLDFAFRITGSAPFRPVRVYHDGKHTYIDLKPSYSGPLPALVPGRSEENKVLNTRVEAGGTRLVADRVIRDMWLQAGKRRGAHHQAGRTMTGARPKTLTGAAIMELQPRRSCAAISRGRAATAKSAFRSVCVLAVLGLPGGLLAGCATQGNDGGSLASLFASKDRPEVVVSEAQACAIGYDLARAIHDTVSLRRTVIVAPKNAGPCERHALNYLRLAGFRIDDGAGNEQTTGSQRAPGITLDIELTRFDGATAGGGDTVSAVARGLAGA